MIMPNFTRQRKLTISELELFLGKQLWDGTLGYYLYNHKLLILCLYDDSFLDRYELTIYNVTQFSGDFDFENMRLCLEQSVVDNKTLITIKDDGSNEKAKCHIVFYITADKNHCCYIRRFYSYGKHIDFPEISL
jgi:hypothetical protein